MTRPVFAAQCRPPRMRVRDLSTAEKNNGAATQNPSVTPVFCATPVHPASVFVSQSVRVPGLFTGLGYVR